MLIFVVPVRTIWRVKVIANKSFIDARPVAWTLPVVLIAFLLLLELAFLPRAPACIFVGAITAAFCCSCGGGGHSGGISNCSCPGCCCRCDVCGVFPRLAELGLLVFTVGTICRRVLVAHVLFQNALPIQRTLPLYVRTRHGISVWKCAANCEEHYPCRDVQATTTHSSSRCESPRVSRHFGFARSSGPNGLSVTVSI